MGRKLRVDFSNEGGSDDNNDSHGHVSIGIQIGL